MATLTTALETDFTPAASDFNCQVTGGDAYLYRKQTTGAAWAIAGALQNGSAVTVSNPVAGAVYKFVARSGSPVVQADQ